MKRFHPVVLVLYLLASNRVASRFASIAASFEFIDRALLLQHSFFGLNYPVCSLLGVEGGVT